MAHRIESVQRRPQESEIVSIRQLFRSPSFWPLQIAGWASYFVMVVATFLPVLPAERSVWLLIQVKSVRTLAGFLLTCGLRLLLRRLDSRGSFLRTALVVIAGAVTGGAVWLAIMSAVFVPAARSEMSTLVSVAIPAPREWLDYSLTLLAWSALYLGLRWWQELEDERARALEATALAQQAQLDALRYQLNPHFLFNTLNAISTLILDSENRTANQAVMRLSEFLRYTLDQDPMKKVTLRQEIEAMNLYLTTEKLRFGDRLRLEFAVEERALEALVPSLLLQPLIENSIKYAVSPSEKGGTVRVEGRSRGSMLELVVADDGPGMNTGAAPGAGRGVGLRNTRERLAVLYEDRHRFATLDNKPGLRIELGLPLETDTP
jgi:two-component system LytT family sensor kinase